MPQFDKSTWSEGQAVVIARQGRQGLETYPATVTKIGRAWLTVEGDSRVAVRYDFTGRQDSDIGHRSQLWPSREAFELEQARRKAWYRLKNAIGYDPPDHLSADDIESMFAQVSPET